MASFPAVRTLPADCKLASKPANRKMLSRRRADGQTQNPEPLTPHPPAAIVIGADVLFENRLCMARKPGARTIVWIGRGPPPSSAAWAGRFAQADVRVARTPAEAVRLLRETGAELVVAESPQILARLDREPEDQRAVLEALAEGVCVTDLEGHIRWSNRAFRELGPEAAEAVMRLVQRTAQGGRSDRRPGSARRGRRTARQHTTRGTVYQISLTPIADSEGRPTRTVAVVTDRTAQALLQRRLGAIDEAGRTLLHLEPETVRGMNPGERLEMLRGQVVRLTRDLLKFDHFRIRLRDPASNRLDLLLTEGLQDADDRRELRAETEGSGISGYVAATGQPYICNDTEQDPRYLPCLAEARSSLTVPLWSRDKVVGTFNVESAQRGAFGQQDVQALEIFAHYVAQALATLQLLVAEKVSTVDQLAADVTDELSEPLRTILDAVEGLKADYVGHDADTLRRLDEVTDAVDRIRRRVRRATDLKRPVRGTIPVVQEATTPLADRRILVADDEVTMRETLEQILGSLGAAVDLARDGAEAVRMGRSAAYDLVLADIRMPQKNGYEVFSALREARPGLPIILMTAFGYDPSHSIVRANEEGLQAVLFKPFKIGLLYEQIGEALGVRLELES